MSLVNRIRFSRSNRSLTSRIRAAAPRVKLFLKSLEDRTVPATFFVTNTLDGAVANAGDLPGSLRQAIFDANTASGADTIDATAALGTITLVAGEFSVTGDTAIIGSGASKLTIDAAKLSRHFNVSDDTIAQISVSMSGMTLTNGQAPAYTGLAPFPSGAGGSIYVRNEKLTIDSMVITGNTSGPNSNGGGIGGGESAIPQQFNTSGYGFWLTVTNSQIENNVAQGLGANGGGIHFSFPNSGINFPGATGNVFLIANSTVSNNTGGKRGGGIYFSGNASAQLSSSFSMRNTTVSGNKSLNEFAGGVLIASTTSLPMSILNSTITNNTGSTSPGAGGLMLNTGTGTINIEGSIIADNFGGNVASDILSSTTQINSKNNIIGTKTGITSYLSDKGGTIISSAKLAPLTNNGGITLTHLPYYNSPAVNAGSVTATTITVAMTNVDTTATVASTANLTIGSLIRIDNEAMLITNIAGLVVTVTRAQNSTTAAAHTLGKAVNNGIAAATTLSAAAAPAATTVTVASASNLSVGTFIGIDTEVVQITAIAGTTVTITPALAAAHVIGAGVNQASTTQAILGPAITAGATSVFVVNNIGIAPGQSLRIDNENITVTEVKAAAATTLAAAMTPTDTFALVASTANLVVGMPLTVDFEIVNVTSLPVVTATLVSAISNTATLMTVSSATGISVGMLLLIDAGGGNAEYVLVTGTSGTVIGIARGQNGTSAAGHAAAAPVTTSSIGVQRGQQGTTALSHNSGVSLLAPSLTIVRGQDATTPASHVAARPLLVAKDQLGNARRQGSLVEFGAVELNPVTPAAIGVLTNVTAGNSTGTFDVTFTATAPNLIDVTTLMGKNDRVHVVGPAGSGFDVPATYVTINDGTNGSPRTASYSFTAPGGTWDYLDSGLYSIVMTGGATPVLDTAANAVPGNTVGTFNVAIGRSLVVTDASELVVATALTLAITNTDVTFDVNDATNIANGQYLFIDAGTANTEYVLVTNVSGNTLTVTRAQLGSTAVAHAASAGVVLSTTQWALGQANANVFVSDSITFNTVAMGTTTINVTSTLNITDPVAINGPGITFDGGLAVRIFNASGPGNMAVSFTGLTISNGMAMVTQFDGGLGSGIRGDNEHVTLTNCIVTGNTGGGVALYSLFAGFLTIISSKLDSNIGGGVVLSTAGVPGGGHDLSIQNSSITNNTGSGISGRSVSFNVSNSTIAGNSGAANGGGINIIGSFNSLGNSIINSTITGNSAANAGGGIYMYWSASTTQRVLIGNTTIVGNFTNGGFQNKPGGGVNNQAATDFLVEFDNTVIAGNTNSTVPDLFSKSKVIANNTLIGILQPVSAVVSGFNNKFGSKNSPLNPQLQSLASNGGPTQTMLPYAGSPLVDSAVAVPTLSTLTVNMTAFGTGVVASLANFTSLPTFVMIDSEIMRANSVSLASVTTLTAAITNSATTAIAVASSAAMAVGEFLTIDSEVVQVTLINSGTSINIARAQQGTTAAAHNNAAALLAPTVSFTRGALGTSAVTHSLGASVTIAYTQPALDQRGGSFIRAAGGKVDIGAVEVDPNIPSAVLTSSIPPITSNTPNPVIFNVTFADDVAIDVNTILTNGNNIFRVTGPNGYNVLATYVVGSISNVANGTPRTASFEVSAPLVGGWTTNDNGFYTIAIDTPSVVSDTSATFIEPHVIGQFQVGITLNLIVTNDLDSGAGSLRNALDQANANFGVSDNITFDAAFFSIPRTITLAGGELAITDAVNIVGPGAKFVTLQGAGSRILTIDTQSNLQVITISGMTMTGGNGNSTINAGVTPGGGAILNVDEAVTITDAIITKNDNSGSGTTTNYGGGILLGNALATLTLQNSTLSFNSAGASGGGLSVRYGCLVTIDNCTISGNTAGFGQPTSTADGGGISASLGASGGGIPTPTITLTNSTVSNNFAPSGGGLRMGNGVSNSRFAVLTVVNSTFTGNVALTGTAGGISFGNSLLFTVQNSTITGNYARAGGGGIQLSPGGFNSIYGVNNGAFINTIISGNFNKVSPDIGGGNSTTGFTMSFVNSFVGAVDQTLTKINNVGSQLGSLTSPLDAKLAPLANNGGVTLTHGLLPGSLALNSGTVTPLVTLTSLKAAITDIATTLTVTSVAAILANTFIQIDSEILFVVSSTSSTVTVLRGQQSTTAAVHAILAPIVRTSFLAPTANDQRGAGFPRQIGTIDMGSIEVNPAIPVASGSFKSVVAPVVGSHSVTVTFTDDVAMSLATITGNNNAVRITGPGGFNVLANYVSANPGNGSAVETVTYSFTPPGGGWDSGDNGFYTVTIEPNQIGDGTNFVSSAAVGTLQVAIPLAFVVDTTDDIDDLDYSVGKLSIREAIKLANNSVGTNDAISFSPTVFATPQTISLSLGELVITDPVVITGPGKANVTIDAMGASRILVVSMTPAYWGSTVSMSDMTFANGRNLPSAAGFAGGITSETALLTINSVEIFGVSTPNAGGAIALSTFWAGLTLTNSKLFNNTAFQGAGVYIGNNGSAVTTIPNTVQVLIQNTTFDSNVGGIGGGLASFGGASITIDNSTFTNNSVNSSFTTGGGAIAIDAATLNLMNSTVSNNSASGSSLGGTGNGGGLSFANGAIATISKTLISGNTAAFTSLNGNGGGVFVNGPAFVTINDSTITANIGNATSTTAGGGAGLAMLGSASVTINRSVISNNTALSIGGGIFAVGLTTAATASGTLLINGSTISGNVSSSTVAGTGGGGIAVTGAGGMTLITNSTITGNSSAALGGGILGGTGTTAGTTGLGGHLTIRNSTVAFNTASTAGGGINFNNLPTGTATFTLNMLSSIVSDNTGGDVVNGQVALGARFNMNVGANSLFGTPITGVGTTAGTPIVNAGASLVALANNGGSTDTHALGGGSTAINAGSYATDVLTTLNGALGNLATNTTFTATSAALLGVGQRIRIDSEIMTISALSGTTVTVNRAQEGTVLAAHSSGANVSFSSVVGAFDQRGVSFARVGNGLVDIGAFEVQSAAAKVVVGGVVINSKQSGADKTQRSRVTDVQITFDSKVTFVGGDVNAAAAFTLNRVSPTPGSVTLAASVDNSGPGTVVTLTFIGGAVDNVSLADGRYALHAVASQFASGLDGDGNGTGGDDFLFDEPASPTALDVTKIFRIYGDYTGDGTVATDDFIQFRLALGGTSFAFDFDNDGAVATSDFIQFRLRFGGSI